ncbi:MAG: lipase maturation factor family protein [Elusimicrobia bacterium]|nr:lipase maturation factor family protein [Elusimicrobiota bacterium]
MPSSARSSSKPVLVYDGDCGFCRYWVRRWQSWTGDRVEYAPLQEASAQFPEIPREKFIAAVQLIEPGGQVRSGAAAAFRLLSYVPGWGWGWNLYQRVPGFARVSEWVYRLVADHRTFFSRGTSQYFLTRWFFLRALGLIYLCAFISLWAQVDGLIGHNGILPAQDFLKAAHTQFGAQAYHAWPTLCWLNSSDAFLHVLCGGGAFLSLLLVAGVAPGPILFLLWAFYLSLTAVGREFLSFQWDILLLETGFLAMFFAPWPRPPGYPGGRPWRLWPKFSHESPPSLVVLWLMRWLLFRLMFQSGSVKLLSGDVSWRNWTALTYHYETQPLPTWIGYYAHQLPVWFHRFSVGVMFGIELVVPFLIFFPRRVRLVACALLAFFQILIGLTGNYCFFNLLTLALCLLLLDDAFLRGAIPKNRAALFSFPEPCRPPSWRALLVVPLAAVVLWLSALQMYGRFSGKLPSVGMSLYRNLSPFYLTNGYGLFMVMTTTRPEIIVEGSTDGKVWIEYSFKWKPGDPGRRPKFVEPHQPRLDWQMWFAALGSYQNNPWFMNFLAQILLGSPEVLSLLETNPFPHSPPRYLRALLYEYHFTPLAEKHASGHWWKRELKGLYCPIASLKSDP